MQFAQRLRDTADEELVTPLENFVAAAYREPDLAEELDRADEDAEAEVDEETPIARTATTTAENPRQPRAPTNWIILSCFAKWSLPTDICQMGETQFQMSRVRSTADAENSAGSSLAEMLPYQPSSMEVRNPLDRENPIRISHVICHGTRYNQGARRQDMTATETIAPLRRFWLKHFDALEVLIMDQGTEFGADF